MVSVGGLATIVQSTCPSVKMDKNNKKNSPVRQTVKAGIAAACCTESSSSQFTEKDLSSAAFL